jgi:hypothetical protein
MKQKKLSLAILFLVFFSWNVFSQTCPPVGDPYVESSCIAGIQRIIARSVNAEGLSIWNYQSTCWDGSASGLPANSNCTPPYDKCWGNYCTSKYSQTIQMLVELNASLVVRAANISGRAGGMKQGDPFYNSVAQLVTDINAAYDCAGLRRPVIQGTIFENCDSGVNTVPIPSNIITSFQNDAGFDASYYMNGSIPKTINFSQSRINYTIQNQYTVNCPDITKIEARMWFYYLAKIYIDLGYKSIHMGQANLWGDKNNNFNSTINVISRIRNYASQQNKFVLLTEENFKSLKNPGTNTFMFDYDSRAMRPREISNPQVCGDAYDGVTCNTFVNPLYFANTPCGSEQYPAIIDPCVITNIGVNSPAFTDGYHPLYNCYMPYLPYNTYFDFGPGIHSNPGSASTGCPSQSNSDIGTWGWDDTKWFAEKISLNCRNYWMGDAVCRLRNWQNGFGFMTAPGLLLVKKPENYSNTAPQPVADGSYLLIDEPLVKSTIISKWQPSLAMIDINKLCDYSIGTCNSSTPLLQNKYTFTTTNPDCSTIYTWHILNPNGTWQPFVYGTQRVFNPSQTGTYTIYLRQDNLAYPAGNYGSKTDAYQIYLYRSCCGSSDLRLAASDNNANNNDEGPVSFVKIDNLDAFNYHILHDELVVEGQPTNNVIINTEYTINVYPNPSSQDWSVSINKFNDNLLEFKLYNNLGELIWKSATNETGAFNFRVPNLNLPNGLYYLYTNTNHVEQNFKLIKE